MAKTYRLCGGCGKRLLPIEIKNDLRVTTSTPGLQLVCKHCYEQWRIKSVDEILGRFE
jgi:hypothetical protein